VIAATSVGVGVTIEVEITGPPGTCVMQARLVVGRLGTRVWPHRPDNRIVEGEPVVYVIPNGQQLTVRFDPTEPGIYPVFIIAELIDDDPTLPRFAGSLANLGKVLVR